MIIETTKDLYLLTKKSLSESYNVNVFEVDFNDYHLDKPTLFKKFNIEYASLIEFDSINDSPLISNYGISNDVKGWVSYYSKKDLSLHSAVFIINDIDLIHESDEEEMDNEKQSELINLYKYITLLHEFGHVADFQKNINIKNTGSSLSIDLIKAEAYADSFALRKMKNSSELFVKLARMEMAKAIIARKHHNEFYNQVYIATTKLVPEYKIKKWAEQKFNK